jgi:hypothetical protein
MPFVCRLDASRPRIILAFAVTSLVVRAGLTVTRSSHLAANERIPNARQTIELPKSGFTLEADGRLKTEFTPREGAEHGALELKRRFPMLRIRICHAASPSRHDLHA